MPSNISAKMIQDLRKNLVSPAVFHELMEVEIPVTYRDLINLWRWYQTNSPKYQELMVDIVQFQKFDIPEAYGQFYQQYKSILQPLFDTLISQPEYVISFYLKGEESNLLIYHSSQTWHTLCEQAIENKDTDEIHKLFTKGPFWILSQEIPGAKKEFYDLLQDNQLFGERYVGILCYQNTKN